MKKLSTHMILQKMYKQIIVMTFPSQQSESLLPVSECVQESKSILPQLTFCWWKKVGAWMAMSM